MTTTISINQRSRTAEFVDRQAFVLGETLDPLAIRGILGADIASLAIFVYKPSDGTLLAGSFNDLLAPESREITKVLDQYITSLNFLSADCVNLFSDSHEDQDVMLVVRDAYIVFCKCLVPMRFVPNVVAGPAPGLPTLEAAFASHNLAPDAHLPLVACAQIPDLSLNALDDNLTFSQLVTNFNALITALRTPRT